MTVRHETAEWRATSDKGATRAICDERERGDGRDGREHRVRQEPTSDDRGSKFRKPRTLVRL